MQQRWGGLLFLHWPVPAEELRRLVPEPLEIETFGGSAWVGITPFSMWGVAPPHLPALPLVSRSLEINVRTYVRLNGDPGVWFFSLDAENPLFVWGARLGFRLPYFRARMHREEIAGTTVRFSSCRLDTRPARFEAEWRTGEAIPPMEPGSLAFFLIERYLLFAGDKGRLFSARIRHPPWSLREAVLESLTSNLAESQGLVLPQIPPLLHAQAKPLKVLVWSPRRVR